MTAISGNMAFNYGTDRPEILPDLQVYSVLFFNNLCAKFGKEKQACLHLPTQSKMFNNYFHNLWLS
jgi:hypothetical protein